MRVRRQKNKLFTKFLIFIFIFLFIFSFVFTVIYFMKKKTVPSISEMYKDWQASSYNSVYLKSMSFLKEYPFNQDVLALSGFSSYYIYIAESDEASNLLYLENTITSLRKAMYFVDEKDKGKLAYILGKAYYQKGEYYSDLAVKYLDIAKEHNIKFKDLDEFKGMALLNLGELDGAIEAFTQALLSSPSPFLLYILGQAYMKKSDFENAKQYFFETITKTKDEILQLKCRYLIGSILLEEGDLERAKSEFLAILEKDDSSSDAHYGLGLVLEKEGDIVKARSEWRRALKSDPSHEKTREKLKV